jgi:RNA-directed DNA polymerase
MLWSWSNKMNKLFKQRIISLIEKENDHNENKLNMVTSENGLISNMKLIFIFEIYSSVAMLNKMINIELCQRDDTSINQSLTLYLEQINCRQNGGRITDQANASINLDDSGNRKYFHTKFHGISIFDRQLNSVLLISTHSKLTKRTISYDAREKVNTFKNNKKTQNKNWPDKWEAIERKVRIEQMKLCVLAENSHGTVSNEVLSIQRKLALSLNFRLLAVKITTTNLGKNIPEVDGKLIYSKNKKWQLVEDIRCWIMDPDKYMAQPVKYVNIPESNNKLKPLGIPNIEERCLQTLISLVLEPLVEMNSDLHSYGSRKFRSTKMVIDAVKYYLRYYPYKYKKYVLNVKIEKFFDTISHDWILKYIPLEITLKSILEKSLKGGSLYLTKFEATERETPQGGILSACLANFTLNGLEEYINEKVRIKYKGLIAKGFNVKGIRDKENKGYKWIPSVFKTITVRYVDHLLVFGRSKRMIESCVRPAIEEFLKERGLMLSKEKTKILFLQNGYKISFLGLLFYYKRKLSRKQKKFIDKAFKENYMKKIKDIKNIFRKSYFDTPYTLITKLNPVIKEWTNKFNRRKKRNYSLLNELYYALSWYIFVWLRQKYYIWDIMKIARYFFLPPKKLRKGWANLTNIYYSGKLNKWAFWGYTKRSSKYNEFEGGKYIELLDPTVNRKTKRTRRDKIPSNSKTVHAYPSKIERTILKKSQKLPIVLKTYLGTLGLEVYDKQNGLCVLCKGNLNLDRGNVIMRTWKEPYIYTYYEYRDKKVFKKYRSDMTITELIQLKNLELVHRACDNADPSRKKVNEKNDKD